MKGCEENTWKSRNSFDVLRLYAALSVMVLHFSGAALYYEKIQSPILHFVREIALAIPGHVVLFTISGFLIAASCEKYGWREFLRKRVLRIVPPIWLETIVNCIVLSLLVGVTFHKKMLLWLATQFFCLAWTPSDLEVLKSGSANGALWTILVQLQMYVLARILWPLWKNRSDRDWLILIGICLGLNLITGPFPGSPVTVVHRYTAILNRSVIPYFIWFLMGMFLYRRRREFIPMCSRLFPWLGGGLIIWRLLLTTGKILVPGNYTDLVTGMLVSVLTITAAFVLPAWKFRQDITYELFLYHWIVLNIILELGLMRIWPLTVVFAIFLAVSIGTALIARECCSNVMRISEKIHKSCLAIRASH